MVYASKKSHILSNRTVLLKKGECTTNYPRHRRAGQGVINIKVNSKIRNALGMVVISEDDELLIITVEGKVIRFKISQVRASGRATQGVRIIHLEDKDRVCSIAKVSES
jgi:DNA gyrase subunit A